MMKNVNVAEHPLVLKYELQGTIGSGSYGKAVVAIRKSDNERVIIKQILLSDLDDKVREEALREAQLLAQFDHVNIIHYYECVLEEGSLNIVMEYASEGDLADVVARRAAEKKPFSEDEIMFWFVQIVLALYHVHSKNVLHRDLKSQNIFISEGNILKLGDFGISRVLNSDTELARTVIGTPYYLSPEICEDRPYNRKSDVWALGCVLYELCTLRRAFDGQSLPALVVKILKGKYPPVPTRYCSSLRSLVDSMLRQNPKDRPSVDGILRLAYVRGHVEKYAQHVMALSPVTPAELGIAQPADATPEPRGRSAAVTPARASIAAAPAPAAAPAAVGPAITPAKARIMGVSAHRSQSSEGAAPAAASDSRAERVHSGHAAGPTPVVPAIAVHDAPGGSRPVSAASGADGHLRGVAPPPMTDSGAAGLAGKKLAANNRNALVGNTWMRQQQAALSELEGALALHGQGAGAGRRGAGAAGGAGAEGDGDDGGQVAAARPGSAKPDANMAGSMAQGPGGTLPSSMGRAKLLEMKAAQRDAELEANKLAVLQERERKKAAAARRSAEAATAVRSRVVERQREVEKHLAEQRAREEEKAKRATELAQHLKSKEEEKAKLRNDIADHMAAHAAHIKQAKARINRDELAKLGADFAARMQHVPPAAAAAANVLVVDLGPGNRAQSTPAPAAGGGARPGASPAAAGRAASGGSPAKPSAAHAASTPTKATPSRAGQQAAAQQAQQATPAAEPPWRAARAAGANRTPGSFPDVQIFTPFGSELTPPASAEPGPRPARTHSARAAGPSPAAAAAGAAAGRPSPGPSRSPGDAPGSSSPGDKVLAAWARRGKAELLEVLSQIQEVLAEEEEEEESAPPGRAAPPAPRPPAAPRVGSARGGADVRLGAKHGLHLPPEAEAEEDEASATTRSDASDAAANAHKVETLRMMLESELGAQPFVQAYKYLQDVSRRAMEREDGGGGGGDDGDQQAVLQRLLGRKAHLAHQIHKLITLEEKVFGI